MHVLTTGASSGIGEAVARLYAKRGATITVVARRQNKLEALRLSLGDDANVHILVRDLSDVGAAGRLIDDAEDLGGPVDVLINNAGTQIVAPFESSSTDDILAMLNLNLNAAIVLAHRAVSKMKTRRRGVVVNVASAAAFASPPGMAVYGASKAGLGMFSEVLHAELKGSGVHVVTVYPGPVKTPMGETGQNAYEAGWQLKVQQWGTPDVLAAKIVDAVDKSHTRVVYPSSYAPIRYVGAVAQALTARFTPPLKPFIT